jgi:hypothetical protein
LPDELTKSWHSCEINLENPIKGENLVCVNVKGGLPNERYYKLSYQENLKSQGYICTNNCNQQPNDFLIKTKPGIFNKTLSSTTILQEFQDILNNYLTFCPSKDENCIIPLAIKADQDILIKNPEIIYQTSTEIKSTNK